MGGGVSMKLWAMFVSTEKKWVVLNVLVVSNPCALTQIWQITFTTDDNLWNDFRWTEQTRIVATITQAVFLCGSCYIYSGPPAKWKVTKSWSCLTWKNWRRRGRWWRGAAWGWGGLPAYLFEETKPAKCSLTWNRQSRAGTGLIDGNHCNIRATTSPPLRHLFGMSTMSTWQI